MGRGVRIPAARHRRDSSPSSDEVGGLVFDFESLEDVGAVVAAMASHERSVPRRTTRTRHQRGTWP